MSIDNNIHLTACSSDFLKENYEEILMCLQVLNMLKLRSLLLDTQVDLRNAQNTSFIFSLVLSQ